MSIRTIVLSAGAAALLALAASTAQAADQRSSCFLASEWGNWHAPSPKVIYLRVNSNDIYRLDLSAGSDMLQDPDVHLINQVHGSAWICSAIDLQLEVAEQGGMREGLIVQSMTHLTPDEVKAIPRKDLP